MGARRGSFSRARLRIVAASSHGVWKSDQRPNFRSAVRFLTPAAVALRTASNESRTSPLSSSAASEQTCPEQRRPNPFDAASARSDRHRGDVLQQAHDGRDRRAAIPVRRGDGWSGSVKNGPRVLRERAAVRPSRHRRVAIAERQTNSNKLLSLGKGHSANLLWRRQRPAASGRLPLGGYWQDADQGFADGTAMASSTAPTARSTAPRTRRARRSLPAR